MTGWVYVAVIAGFLCSTYLAVKGMENFGFLMLASTTALQLAYHWSWRRKVA